MKREDKGKIIDGIVTKLNENTHFYLTDISDLNAVDTNDLRRLCFKNDIQLVAAKNTLLKKAFEKVDADLEAIYPSLAGHTSVMFSNTGNAPAKLIQEFRKKYKKPLLKAAYVEESIYIGEEQLENLVNIKSKEELVADVIALLQSPMKNVVSALQSGGNILTGVLKTLSEKE